MRCAQLEVLLDLYDRGMREPLPLALPDVGGVRRGRQPARAEWESDRFPKEDRDAEHELVVRPACSVRVAAGRPRRATTSTGTRSSATRFGQYALRLWRRAAGGEALGEA